MKKQGESKHALFSGDSSGPSSEKTAFVMTPSFFRSRIGHFNLWLQLPYPLSGGCRILRSHFSSAVRVHRIPHLGVYEGIQDILLGTSLAGNLLSFDGSSLAAIWRLWNSQRHWALGDSRCKEASAQIPNVCTPPSSAINTHLQT